MIRDNLSFIAAPLTHSFNLSLATGEFPTQLKRSTVISLFKKEGDRSKAAKSRPISLVDYVSKVLEKMVIIRVDNYLADVGFFSPSHFGFRRARNADLALAHLWQTICNAIEENHLCLDVFLDQAATFSCINHETFISVIKHF